MASSMNTGKAGVIKAPDDAGSMDQLVSCQPSFVCATRPSTVTAATLFLTTDALCHVDARRVGRSALQCDPRLIIKVHRDEKIARAATAAILVEKVASNHSDTSTPDARPDVRVETDAAIYDEGKVLLKGNPLVTTKDIIVHGVIYLDYSIQPMAKAQGNLIPASSTARSARTSTNQVTTSMDRLGSHKVPEGAKRRRIWRRKSIRTPPPTHQRQRLKEGTEEERPRGRQICSRFPLRRAANVNDAFS